VCQQVAVRDGAGANPPMAPAPSALPFRARLPATKSRWSCDLCDTLGTRVAPFQEFIGDFFPLIAQCRNRDLCAKSLTCADAERVVDTTIFRQQKISGRSEFTTPRRCRGNCIDECLAQRAFIEHVQSGCGGATGRGHFHAQIGRCFALREQGRRPNQ
jgi:hypothetical protein